jgi:mRNA-degrading endonuclease YafQ of YafQ-DinJ toxin-antitoxin module
LLVSASKAQNTIEETIATLNEVSNVQVFVDHKLITDWSGVRRDIKLRDFSIAFDTTANSTKEYYSDLIISQAKVTLFRYKKYTAFTTWQQGGPEPMNVFYTMAQPGDRYELQLTLIAQRKTGERVALKNKLIYNLPIH